MMSPAPTSCYENRSAPPPEVDEFGEIEADEVVTSDDEEIFIVEVFAVDELCECADDAEFFILVEGFLDAELWFGEPSVREMSLEIVCKSLVRTDVDVLDTSVGF